MGYQKTSMGLIDDGPAEFLEKAIADVRERYRVDLGREPSKLEIHAIFALFLEPLDGLSEDAVMSEQTKPDATPEELRAEVRALRANLEMLYAHNKVLKRRAAEAGGTMLASALVGGLIGCALGSAPGRKDDETLH